MFKYMISAFTTKKKENQVKKKINLNFFQVIFVEK